MAIPLKGKLWVLLVIPVAVLILLHSFSARARRTLILMEEASTELREQTTLVQSALAESIPLGADKMALLRERIERLPNLRRTRGVALFDRSGQLIAARGDAHDMIPTLAGASRRAVTEQRGIEEKRDVHGATYLIRAARLYGIGWEEGPIVVLARDLEYAGIIGREFDQRLAATGSAAMGLAILAVALITWASIGRPSRALLHSVRHIAEGNLKTSVPEGGADEVVQIARAFNAMVDSLRQAQAKIENASRERAATERRLQRAQVAAMVSHVAHEIGSPLNTILGRARLSAANPDCPEDVRSALEIIASQSERIARVMGEMVEAARPSHRPMQAGECDLALVAEQALAFLEPECRRRRVPARLECGAFPAYVMVDEERAFQILFNLCLNAVEVQPDGGEVTLRILPGPRQVAGSSRVSLDVEDRGPALTAELAESVLDTLAVRDARGAGALCLAIARGLISEVGGSFELGPSEHGGTVCHITLPGSSGAPAPVMEAAL